MRRFGGVSRQVKNEKTQKTGKQNYMSLQKTKDQPQKQQLTLRVQPKNVQQIVANGQTLRYHFLAKDAETPVQGQTVDQTLLWKTELPRLVPGRIRKRVIVFKQIQYVISQWTGDKFPSVIYLCVDGMTGYKARDGVSTNRLAALQLQDMNPMLDQSNLKTFDLKYVIKTPVNWEVPATVDQIKLRVKIDEETDAQQLPLPNPLSINCEVRLQ